MPVNMGFLNDEKLRFKETLTQALRRRRQLVDWPMTPDDFMDVFYDPLTARAMRFIRDTNPRALHWYSHMVVFLSVPKEDYAKGAIPIELITEKPMPMPVSAIAPRIPGDETAAGRLYCSEDNPATSRLRVWAWKAFHLELENRWVINQVAKVLRASSTHQQVHRFLPDIHALLANEEKDMPKNRWDRQRFVELHAELGDIGSSRARNLDLQISVKERVAIRAVIAQALLMPKSDGMAEGSGFHLTWVEPTHQPEGRS